MELRETIGQIEKLKELLDSYRPFNEAKVNRLNQQLKLEWNYHSNRIEGNTLTESETRSFLLNGITAGGKPFRDYLEMKGHNEAITKLFKLVDKDLKITETLIKEFHRMILVEEFWDNGAEIKPGEWKTLNNYLYSYTGERIDFAPAEEVSTLMNELINWLNNHLSPPKRKKDKFDLHPLLIAASFHIRFIDIHPFGDGNGRMARILSNLILMISGYPPMVVKASAKDEYYRALNESTIIDPAPIATLFGQLLIESMQATLNAVQGSSLASLDEMEAGLQRLGKEVSED